MECCVCKTQNPAYKCPKCALKYCSCMCYKDHKINCNEYVLSSPVLDVQNDDSNVFLFPTKDTVPSYLLEELKNSSKLIGILENPHLRNILLEVNSAKSSYHAMQSAMQEPIFTEFVDVCLEIVEPGEEDTVREDTSL